jgi:hypothetical protein
MTKRSDDDRFAMKVATVLFAANAGFSALALFAKLTEPQTFLPFMVLGILNVIAASIAFGEL